MAAGLLSGRAVGRNTNVAGIDTALLPIVLSIGSRSRWSKRVVGRRCSWRRCRRSRRSRRCSGEVAAVVPAWVWGAMRILWHHVMEVFCISRPPISNGRRGVAEGVLALDEKNAALNRLEVILCNGPKRIPKRKRPRAQSGIDVGKLEIIRCD